jgi:hypothetical protein
MVAIRFLVTLPPLVGAVARQPVPLALPVVLVVEAQTSPPLAVRVSLAKGSRVVLVMVVLVVVVVVPGKLETLKC